MVFLRPGSGKKYHFHPKSQGKSGKYFLRSAYVNPDLSVNDVAVKSIQLLKLSTLDVMICR